jgi:hypothetical protein
MDSIVPDSAPASDERSELPRPGFVRLTASDRPGIAQPVPVRDIPTRPWPTMFACVVALTLLALGVWEWRMRALELMPGDLGDSASGWAEQRRRIDTENVQVAIVGDSRILFDTNLDRFEQLTGVRPLQLALAGTNARPFLQNLAEDANFHGLAIVGIAENSYFRDGIGLNGDALKRYRYESPAQRSSFLLHNAISRVFAFIDEEYRLSKLVRRLDPNLRARVNGPYDGVWKVSEVVDQRQTWLWPRLEHDERLRNHARAVFQTAGGLVIAFPTVPDDVIERAKSMTRDAVAKIRAHGGEVVFVRPPSANELLASEEKRLPRARAWDPLLAAADVRGIHFADAPEMQGMVLPENSHLTRACARVFTDAYVRRVAQLTSRLALRPDAPHALLPADCTAGPAR